MSRLETKFRLMRELGSVLDPIQRLLADSSQPSPTRAKVAVVLAQFRKDWRAWFDRFAEFCSVDGGILQPFHNNMYQPLSNIESLLERYPGDLEEVRKQFPLMLSQAEAALRDVPADDPDVLLPPQSPFQTYLRLLAICGGTLTRLQLFDPYLDAEIFDRYLPDIGKGVEITLVTEVANMRNARRRGRIIAISELVALERPTHYRLLEVPSIHDRHLRADDKIFHLGGSAKDASKQDFYTIAETDSNLTLHSTLDGIVAGSTAWHQPGMPRHRRWCPTCNHPSDVQTSGACIVCCTQT